MCYGVTIQSSECECAEVGEDIYLGCFPQASLMSCATSHFPSSLISARFNSISCRFCRRRAFCMNRRLSVPLLKDFDIMVDGNQQV